MEQKRILKEDKNPISTRELIPSDKPVTKDHVDNFVKKRLSRIAKEKAIDKKEAGK